MIGAKIVRIRKLTKSELGFEGWDDANVVGIELDNGTILYASRDEEGNGAGALFGQNPKDESGFILLIQKGGKNE